MAPITPITWYFFGDIDCYMRGGKGGTDYDLANALSQPGVDAQAIIDNEGSATAPPGIADVVSVLVQNNPNRDPAVPAWTPQDWPLDWQVRYVPASQSGVDPLVLQPGIVAFQWPPAGGDGLSVNINGLTPNLSDSHTVRYGDTVFQAADQMITDPKWRQVVENAAVQAGSIDRVNALAIMQQVDPSLLTTKAPPATFSVALDSTIKTTETWLGVNPLGGVHLQAGWIAVPQAVGDTGDPSPIEMREYPCGGFL